MVYMNSCITGHTSTEESSTTTEEQVCVPRVPPLPVAKCDDPLNSEVCLVKWYLLSAENSEVKVSYLILVNSFNFQDCAKDVVLH